MPDQWEFYPSKVDGEPASIYVNVAYRDSAPVANAPDLTWLRVYLLHPRDDGLSSDEDFQRLCAIEDAVVKAIEDQHSPVHYVGRNTSGGCRDFYVYNANGLAIESVLGQAMVPFADYEFETGSREDPDWSAYRDFLCPSPRDMQLIQNQHVLESLQESNDLIDIPRDVLHWAYFADERSRDEFVFVSRTLGFQLHHAIDPDADNDKWGATLIRNHAVDYWTLADATLALYDIATGLGGDYDGWETPVVDDPSHAESPK